METARPAAGCPHRRPATHEGRAGGLTMPRPTYLAGLALLLVAGALLLTEWLLAPAPGVTWENVRRLRPGMTGEEVERLLGGPPRGTGCGMLVGSPAHYRTGDWGGPGWIVSVWFGEDGRVALVSRHDAGAGFGVQVEPEGGGPL